MRINRDANGADTLRKMRARERKSRASFHSINSPNDRDWIYRQVGRNQLSVRILDPIPDLRGTQRRRIKFVSPNVRSREPDPRRFEVILINYLGIKGKGKIIQSLLAFLNVKLLDIRKSSEDMTFLPRHRAIWISMRGYLRARAVLEHFLTKFRDGHFMRNGTHSNFPLVRGKLHDSQVPHGRHVSNM